MGGQLLTTQPVAGPLGSPFVLLCTDGLGASTGVTFGAFETGGTVGDQFFARTMRYRGYQTWVVVQGDSIYRTTDAGASWSTVYGPDADLGGTVCKSGLHLVYPGGVATLMFMARGAAGMFSVFSSADGITWTKTGPVALTSQTSALQANAFWQGGIFCSAGLGGSARTYRADIGLKTILEITQPDVHGSQNDSCFAVFNDRLFGVWTKLSDGRIGLWELVGLGWTLVTTFAAAATPAFAADRKLALFVQGANLYLVGIAGNPIAWTCYEITSALAVTDVSAATMTPIAGGETNTSRAGVIVDGPIAGGGTVPEIDLYISADGVSGTAVATYRFNGSFVPITALAGGNSVQNTWPFGVQYGGNVFWTAGQQTVELVTALPTLTGGSGVRWGFQLFSPNSSPDLVNVRGFWGTAQDEYACGQLGPNPNAVLASPSSGSLVGQTITGLDAADNGATTFEVTWLAPTNGGFPFAIGAYAKNVLEVF